MEKKEKNVNANSITEPNRTKMVIGIVVFVLILVAMVVIIAVFAKDDNGFEDNPQNHQMINKDVVKFILKNKWYNDSTRKILEDIGTIPNNSTTNTGVKYNNKTQNWSIQILIGAGSKWTSHAMDLGNLSKESDIIDKINNPKKTWTFDDKDKTVLYFTLISKNILI